MNRQNSFAIRDTQENPGSRKSESHCGQCRVSRSRALSFFRTTYAAMIVLVFSSGLTHAADQVDYLAKIKPLLRERCYACHGALKQEANLRLDTAAAMLAGGDSGPAAVRGAASDSLLLERVSTSNLDDRMPPKDLGEPLTDAQVDLLRQWITAGATAPADEKPEADPEDHWAFQAIARPDIPATNSGWVRNPIDAFLEQKHREHGLSPQPEAPRIVLLRRLYFDLLGLPPQPDEITAFENAESENSYEEAVERLLNDSRHGERWARHWMDIWRYSDWWGLGEQLRNSQKHIWHWRDWIIESLNHDAPYDEMVRLMLAADELHPNDLDRLRATGYLARNYFLFNRPQWMEETVEHVSKGFLGLTMNCARCHDHKFDPIEQTDYYRIRAFFEPYHVRLDVVPGEPDLANDGIPRVFDGLLEAPTWLYIRGDERNPDTSAPISPGIPSVLEFDELKIDLVALPEGAWQPARRPWVFAGHLDAAAARLESAQSALRDIPAKQTSATAPDNESSIEQWNVRVAEAAVSLAEADLESIRMRAAAQAAEWNDTDSSRKQKHIAAIRAERRFREARLRHEATVAERSLHQAADDKKAAAEETLQTARRELEKAITESAAEITPDDQYTSLIGAAWTPTRFFDSTKDDPTVTFPATSTGRRTALANWITDRRNPLTARVAVNHIWTRHMGQPLVPTVFDFGRRGIPPAHPELLDWLAAELMDHNWSMKHLHRLIVTSAAYRMSSSVSSSDDCVSIDPENRYWWRRVPIRIESQAVRDALLALAGTLDTSIGGPPVPRDQQDTSTRRSLYFFHSNNERNLFLTMFDEALVKDCYRREQSIVPQQALALTNSNLVLEASDQIVVRLSGTAPDDTEFVRSAFRVITGINPNDAEQAAAAAAMQQWRRLEQDARTLLVWTLINHNDFVTLR